MHGIPHFAISIALRINDELKSGLIFDPIKNEIFYAEKNGGAYFNNHRVRVSSKIDLEECLFSSNSYGVKFATPNLNMRNTGCAALDLAYVGSGRLDGFFHNKINIWDIAAGILIIDEAGGKVSDISEFGDEAIDIRASNSNIYQKMLEKIKNF
jgi:myo-inositol-1(or 4)-monophosphatase